MSKLQDTSPLVEVRLRLVWVPLLALAFLLLQQFLSSHVWSVLSLFFGLSWIGSYLWARALAAGLRITRHQKFGWNQVGDVFEERIQLDNNAYVPALWLAIVDHTTLTGHSISLGTGLGSASRRHWTKRTVCTRRGEYRLGPTTLETGDIFGIYRVSIHYPHTEDFLVAPPVISLPLEAQISIGQTLADQRFSNKRAESSMVSVSTREFTPGDSLKRIHWLITAKEDTPHVRQFENIHAARSCWVVLDLDHSVHDPGEAPQSVERAIILAISLVHRFLKEGLAVGLLAQGTSFAMAPPGKGPGQLRQVQRLLSTCQAGDEPLQHLLLRTWHYLGEENNLLVVTPSTDPAWINQLRQTQRKKVVPTLLLLKSERQLPNKLTGFSQLASRRGIKSTIIQPKIFQTPEMHPGRQGVVEWRFTPLGRAIKVMGESPLPGEES